MSVIDELHKKFSKLRMVGLEYKLVERGGEIELTLKETNRRISRLRIPDGVTDINWIGRISVGELIIPGTVKRIKRDSFYTWAEIPKLIIEDGCKEIDSGAFQILSVNYKEIYLPDSVDTINDCAFRSCRGLEKVKLPKNINRLGIEAFYTCEKLKEIKIPDSVEVIDDCAFKGCDLRSVEIPVSCIKIGKQAFSNNRNLREVIVRSEKVVVWNSWLQGCDNLEYLYLPEKYRNTGINTVRKEFKLNNRTKIEFWRS